ncbi:hypothetical protein BH11MYX2_BH11MYX2_41470 [soil metagenome]
MREWLVFLAGIATELYDLFVYVQRPSEQRSIDSEQQLAMRIVRKASDEQARRGIDGP